MGGGSQAEIRHVQHLLQHEVFAMSSAISCGMWLHAARRLVSAPVWWRFMVTPLSIIDLVSFLPWCAVCGPCVCTLCLVSVVLWRLLWCGLWFLPVRQHTSL